MKTSISLKEYFVKEASPRLQKELNLDNSLAVPKVSKVVVNIGVGNLAREEKRINQVIDDISKITGQRPVKTLARKAIAGFKIREGNVVGIKTTLRGQRMYSFLEKLVKVALPRVRDFRGLSADGFDEFGNYNLGLREHIVFPEASTESVENTFPMEITVVTTAKNKDKAYKLLKLLGFPFKEAVK